MSPVELVRMPAGYLKVATVPGAEELEAYYSKKYYQEEHGNYSTSYPEEEVRYFKNKLEQRFQEIKRVSPVLDRLQGRIIDVGCGEGFTLDFFAQRNWEVLGIDFSNFALKRMHPEYLPRFMEGNTNNNLKQLIALDEKFHIIWLSNMLEHVPEPEELMRLLLHVARKETVLAVHVPNDFSLLQNHLLKSGKIDHPFWVVLPDHLSYFDAVSIRNIGEANGWQCASIMADFPIDLFLMNEHANYIHDRSKGTAAHKARLEFENLLHTISVEKVNSFYRAMANIGLGRQLTAFFLPAKQ